MKLSLRDLGKGNMNGVAVRVHYYQDGMLRFLKGILLEENEDFIKVEMDNYVVTLSKKEIAKMEVAKSRRNYDY